MKDLFNKDRWDLVPFPTLALIVKVIQYGAKKYAPNDWQNVPEIRDTYFAAAMRHLVQWRGGERYDPESGLPHLAHAITSLIFCLWDEDRSRPEWE